MTSAKKNYRGPRMDDQQIKKRFSAAKQGIRDGKYHVLFVNREHPYNVVDCSGSTKAEAESKADTKKIKNVAKLAGYIRMKAFKALNDERVVDENFKYNRVMVLLVQGEPMKDAVKAAISEIPGNENMLWEWIDSDKVDAIVLTMSGYEKFMHGPYKKHYGLEHAIQMRENAQKILQKASRKGNSPRVIDTVYHEYDTNSNVV